MKYLPVIIVAILLAGCANTGRNASSAVRNAPQDDTNSSQLKPREPVVFHRDDCKSGRFYACQIRAFGPLSFLPPSTPSALACGRCVDGETQGHVLAIWCKRPGCADVDITRKSDIWGLLIANSRNGAVFGNHVVLVTEIGSYFGSITGDQNLGFGVLKRDRAGNALIGEFNPDGSLKSGVQIERRSDGKFRLIASEFSNNKPMGFAHFYEDDAYTIMYCTTDDCHKHNPNELGDAIREIMRILLVEWIENFPATLDSGVHISSTKLL